MTAEAIAAAASAIAARLGSARPAAAVVLGSGLGALADRLEAAVRVPFAEVPGLAPSTVAGHAGEFVGGRLAGVPVILQRGRLHLYEGHAPEVVVGPVRLMRALGIEVLILTNAAGGIRRTFIPGTLMLVADHLNATFRNPLLGPVAPGEGRFPDMSDPYDAGLRALAREAARERGIALEEGVYAGVLGPSYETPAEIRMLERLGADAVGMSTVAEVIAARAAGMRCLALSLITNVASGLGGTALSHEEVMREGAAAGARVGELIEEIVRRKNRGRSEE